MRISEHIHFYKELLRDPLAVSAIAPSAPGLATLMTAGVSPGNGLVMELGAGTGTLTRALLAKGVAESEIVLVESNPRFAALLRKQYAQSRIVEGDASKLPILLHDVPRQIATVVSGLPLRSMPRPVVLAILDGAFRHLRPDGSFYQFTYGFKCPVPADTLQHLGLRAERVGRVILNAPPATVYRIELRR